MNKITTFRVQKDNTKNIRRYDMSEIVDLITEGKYLSPISDYRSCYPLLRRETAEFLKSATERLLQGVPHICFATEYYQRNNDRVEVGYNPLLMLSVSNLPDERMASEMRSQAATLPYTRLAFVGTTGRDVIIVCELQALGLQLSSRDDYAALFLRGYAHVRKVYSDHLHADMDLSEPQLSATCRISADAEAYYNPLSIPFPVLPYQQTISRTEVQRHAPLDSHADVTFWRRIYVDNLQKAFSATFNSDDPSFETLLLLARYCHETGMPQALAEAFIVQNGEYHNQQILVRDTLATEYEKDLRVQDPTKHLNLTALLMQRTSNFLEAHYRFRRNVLNGIVEYRLNDGTDFNYHLLTAEMQNTMTIAALESGLNTWDKDLNRYIHSKRIPEYDPVNTYLDTLPRWDGRDRIAAFARRVPTDTPNWEHNFHVWMLSMVAQWMGRDSQHGNAIAPILIGAQATGKSSFCRIILPESLMEYYNDSIHFKDDKSVFLALSSFALINIDEFDSLSRSQQPLLKYLLSKTDVKYRAAYRNYIEQHKRYASFIGTTNNRHPLNDPTGSQRFICVKVTGSIDFSTPVEHDQIYAQLREEVLRGDRYWFTKEEADRITMQNAPFHKAMDFASMLSTLFRKPKADEQGDKLTIAAISEELSKAYPNLCLQDGHGSKIGVALNKLGFQQVRTHSTRFYVVVRRGDR